MSIKNNLLLLLLLLLWSSTLMAGSKEGPFTFGVKVFSETANQYVQVAHTLKTFIEEPAFPGDDFHYQLIESSSQPELFQYYIEVMEDQEKLSYGVPPAYSRRQDPRPVNGFGRPFELEYNAYFSCKIIDIKTGAYIGSFGYHYAAKDTIRDAELARTDISKFNRGTAPKDFVAHLYKKNQRRIMEKSARWQKGASIGLSRKMKTTCFYLFRPYFEVTGMSRTNGSKVKTLQLAHPVPPFFEQYAQLKIYQLKNKSGIRLPELLATGQYRKELGQDGQIFVLRGQKKVHQALQEGATLLASFDNDQNKNSFLEFMPGDPINVAIQFDYSAYPFRLFNQRAIENNFEYRAKYSGVKLQVVNRSSQYHLDRLRELFKLDKYLDDVAFGDRDRLIGADYLITVKPGALERDEYVTRTSIPVDVKVSEVATGKVLAERSSRVDITLKSRADFHTLNSYYPLNGLLEEAFGLSIDVVDVLEGKKDNAEEVLIFSTKELTPWHKYEVFRIDVEEVNGQRLGRPVEVGKVTILEAYSQFMGKAKVSKGGKKIAKALAEGKKLTCTRKMGLLGKMYNIRIATGS